MHFAVCSLPERSSGVSVSLDAERAGAVMPRPLVVVVCFTSLAYLVNLKSICCVVRPSAFLIAKT